MFCTIIMFLLYIYILPGNHSVEMIVFLSSILKVHHMDLLGYPESERFLTFACLVGAFTLNKDQSWKLRVFVQRRKSCQFGNAEI